ncbi:DUF6303 family protein [Streptomyces sp. NBC_01506]|uniref:DUF6303 family protein n=1 Tax=Streptomyces sp. NBC_01506 TaxID=2903887 RepID=UPI00386FF9B1
MSGIEPTRAAMRWCVDDGDTEPSWGLHILVDSAEVSLMTARWPDALCPPTLLDRYDALAVLGYAVVRGGPEAWEWLETLDAAGGMFLAAYAEVRPLRVDELISEDAEG